YKFNTTATDWHTARSNCKKQGYHLVAMETREEFDFITRFLKNSPAYLSLNWWTAANDIDNEAQWVWADVNQPMSSSAAPWASTQPDNLGNREHCGDVVSKYGHKMNDAPCEFQYASICEYNLL
ncbi:hypothetical protein CAPTEDRAFT_103991, partial [Capitella teleta]